MLQPSLRGFDTSVIGTPLSCWEKVDRHPWCPEEGPLLVIAPHPDDETLGAGGLIQTWMRRLLPVTIVSVTDGEAACPEVPDLAAIRRSELRAALTKVLSHLVSPDTTIVAPFEKDGHPDHDASALVARQVARQHGATLAEYPIWAWHQATPNAFSARRIVSFSLSQAAREAKREAIGCYVSQRRDRPGGPILPPHVLAYFDRPDEVFLL